MIEIGFEFRPSSRQDIIKALFALPETIRPNRQCRDEGDAGTVIGDYDKFLEAFERRETGTMLKGPAGVFDISLAGNEVIRTSSFIDFDPEAITAFIIKMSCATPIFGFACIPEERERRNRVTTILRSNTVESWVGRGTNRYIPGLYWMTVISDDLMRKHNLSAEELGRIAREYVFLAGGQHFFRFYDRPEDWKTSTDVDNTIRSQSSFFQVEEAKIEISAARTFLELSMILRKWK